MKRERAYEAIAAVYEDIGFDKLGWTAEVVAETERRIAIDDADIWDSSVHFADFALQVLDPLPKIRHALRWLTCWLSGKSCCKAALAGTSRTVTRPPVASSRPR